MNILEPGEQVVLNYDNIKEILRLVDGRIYITNYRVSTTTFNFDFYLDTLSRLQR